MEGTMKKAVILGKKDAGLIEMPIPQPRRDWVLVKMRVVPMCTEYKTWLDPQVGQPVGTRTDAMGHEGVGEVVEVAQPCGVEVGDRVVHYGAGPCGRCVYCRSGNFVFCRNRTSYAEDGAEPTGAFAQYRLGAAWLLPKIPDDISFEHAAMAWCGLGPTFGAMESMDVDAHDTVLITGAGPVAQGGVINARYRGARVIVADSQEPWRVGRVRDLGADAVVDARHEDAADRIKGMTEGLGVTCAIECAGVVAAERLCIDATRPRGRVCFVGECFDPLPIEVSPDMIQKGLTLVGQWHYSLDDFDEMMQLIRESGDLLDILISHRFPMSEIQDALAVQASHKCGKIVLDPWA